MSGASGSIAARPDVRGTASERMGENGRLRILILNWRDIKHPRAGGAERTTYEAARRWVAWGHQVTWFAGSFPGAPDRETVDGIEVWRRGSQATVHWHAFRAYRRHFRGRFDVIVDEVNTIPFFTPLYVREPAVMFFHQLAREVWWYEARFPVNALGYLAEPLYLRAYRRTPAIVASPSTRDDLLELRFCSRIDVFPQALDAVPLDSLPPMTEKDSRPTLIYVGRVVPSKRVHHLVEALAALRHEHGCDARLQIVGSGEPAYQDRLLALARRLNVQEHVELLGRVSFEAKLDLLQRAHLFVMASVREGWGLVITEAASRGTPAVVYDVPGLRDSTIDGVTGVVCKNSSPESLAAAAATLLQDQALYARLREQAWERSMQVTYDQTARAILASLQEMATARRADRR